MNEEALVLPFRADHQQLVEGLAAIVRAIDGLKAAEERTEAQTQKTASALQRLDEGLGRVRGGFRDAWDAVDTWIGRINAAVDRVTALASEQERLDRLTARTGLNLDEAAASAGRFADETEAAGAASAFLQAGTQLTQRELNAVMRVAGAASQTLGITTTQAVQQLTEALRKGEAEGLGRFSPALAQLAGSSHTTAERLGELVREADRTTAATDDAGDAVRRFRDSLEDSARTIASSFVQEMARLQGLGQPFRDARSDAEEFNRTLQAIGQTAAHLVSGVGASLQMALGAIQYVGGQAMRPILAAARAAGLRTNVDGVADGERRMREALARMEALQGDLYDDRRTAPTADPATSGAPRDLPTIEIQGTVTRGGGRRTDPFEARLREENAIQDALREMREQQRAEADRQREREQRFEEMLREAGERSREEQRDRDQTARDRDADLARRQWGRSDAGLRAENDNARVARQESRALDLRRSQLRSFTDFFEEEHGRQIVAAQEAASGISMAFDAMGQAYSRHLQAVIAGREDLGQALQGMLADTLKAISEESGKKAGLMFAEGLAALVFYQYDRAATAFAAGAAYTAVAVGTGYAGAAIAPTPASKGSGDAQRQRAEGRDRVNTGRGGAANDNARGTTIIEHHYYAPVIGGREATDGEVGRGMQRYTGAADRRRLGRTGTGP